MEFNVAQLMKERTGETRHHSVHANIENLDAEIVALDELEGNVRLMRTLAGVLVTGVLSTAVGLVCGRCLTPITQTLDIELEDEFRPSIDMTSGASLPMVDNDEGNRIDAHHILDLSEVVRQRILLNQPLTPLCKSDCLGLCANCGQNLNDGPCNCQEAITDPRWAVLRELLH